MGSEWAKDHHADRDLRGCVARCSKGRFGYITDRVKLTWGWSWIGFGLDDGSPWASRDPEVIRPAVEDDRVGTLARAIVAALNPAPIHYEARHVVQALLDYHPDRPMPCRCDRDSIDI